MQQILLDTNALIALSDPTDNLFRILEESLKAGARALSCSVAWHEYVRGPLLDGDRDRALRVVESRILPLERRHAEAAADLFNKTGRRRGSTADCMIAAVAMAQDAVLLTRNVSDFMKFEVYGLGLLALS